MKSGSQFPEPGAVTRRGPWPSSSSDPTIISTSSASGWRGVHFSVLQFPIAGTVQGVWPGLTIGWPLGSAAIKMAGYGWHRKDPTKIELGLPGRDCLGAWEGEHGGRFLLVTEEFIEIFASNLIEKVTPGIPTTSVLGSTLADSPRIKHLMALLHADVSAGSPDGPTLGEQLTVGVLNNVFPEKRRHTTRGRRGPAPPELNRLRDFIHSQIGSRLSLQDLAAFSGLSSRNVCRIFRAEIGLSPHAYIMRCRVEHASTLILTSKLSMAEIALISGFANQAHMTVTFRKILGVPPLHLARSRS